LVEAGTAAAFVVLASTIRPLFGLPGWWIVAATLGVAALIGVDRQVCPPAVAVIGGASGIGALAVGSLVARHLGPIPQAAVGLGAASAVAGIIAASARTRSVVGTGNISLLPAWGALLGWLGTTPAMIAAGVSGLGFLATAFAATRRRSSGGSTGSRDLFAIWLVIGLAAGVLAAGLRA
jgi:hypothetical protein